MLSALFRNSFRVALLLSFALLLGTAVAQTGTGSLRGLVTDPSGAAVVNGTVSITAASGQSQTVPTGRDGTYQVKGLAPGKYSVRAQAKGFADYEVEADVAAGESRKLDISLAIQVEQQNLDVSDQGMSVDVAPSNNASATVISGKDLDALPDDPDELAADLDALAGPSAGPNGGQIYIDGFTGGQLPPKSSIREIRVNQNPFSSEYDKLGYGRIEVFTKPGTDQWHGQVSVLGNASAFNAKNPFSSIKPDYASQQYSGNIGGPLSKRASLSVSVDRRDITDAAAVNAFILDSNFNQIPYSTSVTVPRTRMVITPRIDFQVTPNNTLTARYQLWRDTDDNAGVGQFSLPSVAYNSHELEQSFQLSDTQTYGTKIVNETRFQYNRDRSQQSPLNTTFTTNVLGAFVSGGNSSGYVNDRQDHYELQNHTSVLSGKHLIKFGARVRDVREANYATIDFNGTFTFNSLRSYQITEQGLANGLTAQQIRAAGGGASQFYMTQGQPNTTVNVVDAGLYLQDDWRLRPNVTLSYGLRYEMQTDIPDKADFAPRLAVAWGIGRGNNPSPKTVLRAGYGMFYDRFQEMYILQADRLNGTTQQQFIVNQPNFYPIIPPLDQINQAKTFPTVYRISPHLRAPYILQAAASVERQISKNANLAVSYLNSRGLHQFLTRNINAPLPGTYNPADPTSGIRPFGDVGNIYQYESAGIFKQNQLIVNANLRAGSKVSLFGYYTLNFANSDTIGTASFPSNQYDLAQDYGPTAFDIRHRVFVSGTIALPHAIRLSPFIIANSGIPFNITTGRDYNGDSIFNDRPAFATDLARPSVVITKYGAFDTAPIAGQTTIPPYYGTGPARFSMNLRVSKAFAFGRETGKPRAEGGPGTGGPGGPGGAHGSYGPGGPRGGGFGGASSGPLALGGGATRRYSLTLSVSGRNIFNHVNVMPLVGNLASPLFGQANALAGGPFGSSSANRRIDLQAMFTF